MAGLGAGLAGAGLTAAALAAGPAAAAPAAAPGALPLALDPAAPAAPAAATPAAADTLRWTLLLAGNRAGEEAAWRDTAGALGFRFSFNDRGRGPEQTARLRLGPDGLPAELRVEGVDYLKKPVVETFERVGGEARWRNPAEEGSARTDGPALYVPMHGGPALGAAGLAALLDAPDGCLPLLPAGRACAERVRTLRLEPPGAAGRAGADAPLQVTLVSVTGLGFSPAYLWWDEEGAFFAAARGWFTAVRAGWEAALPRLSAVQDSAEARWLAGLAERLPRRPEGPVAIEGARLFDPETLEAREGVTVVVRDGRVEAVGPDAEVEVPEGAQRFRAAGRTLLPGLFDMHVHLSPVDGILHLAAGVTTVRDLANDTEDLLELERRIEEGSAVGPRLIRAGFMDGPGPFAGPTRVLVDTEEEAVAAVDRYAELGYEQIKIYSSIRTELVPAIARAAHARGLRLSGHVPAFMTAEEAVRAGFDEIQHANMLFLNFLGDTLDTRTPLRFTAVAAHGAELDLASDSVRAFLRLLAERDVVVDPTLAIFEGQFTARPGELAPMAAPVADRLPPQVRRGYLTGGLPVPEGMDARHRESFRRMVEMVGELHRAGVRIVAGTDAVAGFALHRELELYVEAGIPAPEVLRLATLGAAEVTGRADRLGRVAPGMAADLVLVDGRPDERISDIRRTWLVLKDGVLYVPAELHRAVGVAPR